MTDKLQRRFQFGPLTALGSLLLGGLVFAGGIALNEPPSAAGGALQATMNDPASALAQGTATRPFESAALQRSRTNVNNFDAADVGEIPYVRAVQLPHAWSAAEQSSTRAAHLASASNGECDEQWQPLLSGPVGRHVSRLCRGERPLPLPPSAGAPHHEKLMKLPEPAHFATADLQPIVPPESVSESESKLAASAVDHRLTTRWLTDAHAQDAMTPPRVAQLPLLDPYAWSPS
jgi:hypothetical protein